MHALSGLELRLPTHADDPAALRRAVGLSEGQLAELTGLPVRQVHAWEAGEQPAPPGVLRMLAELDTTMDETATGLVAVMRQQTQQHGRLDCPLSLLVFATDSDLWHYRREFCPLPATLHQALVARCRAALADLKVPSRAVLMDPLAYAAWLSGRTDNASLRTRWAMLQ